MKKLLLGLGTIAAVVAPVSAVIACDMGTMDMTLASNSTLTEADFKTKVDAMQTTKPTTLDEIITTLGLGANTFLVSTDAGTKITINKVSYKDNVLKVETSTVDADKNTLAKNYIVDITFRVTA